MFDYDQLAPSFSKMFAVASLGDGGGSIISLANLFNRSYRSAAIPGLLSRPRTRSSFPLGRLTLGRRCPGGPRLHGCALLLITVWARVCRRFSSFNIPRHGRRSSDPPRGTGYPMAKQGERVHEALASVASASPRWQGRFLITTLIIEETAAQRARILTLPWLCQRWAT